MLPNCYPRFSAAAGCQSEPGARVQIVAVALISSFQPHAFRFAFCRAIRCLPNSRNAASSNCRRQWAGVSGGQRRPAGPALVWASGGDRRGGRVSRPGAAAPEEAEATVAYTKTVRTAIEAEAV